VDYQSANVQGKLQRVESSRGLPAITQALSQGYMSSTHNLLCACYLACRIGMKAGFTMRQQVVAAIHAKVLRLNSAAVGHANIGRIINLARYAQISLCFAPGPTGDDRVSPSSRVLTAIAKTRQAALLTCWLQHSSCLSACKS
jgi:hypothetical protein